MDLADTSESSVVNVVTDQIDKKLNSTLDVGAKALQSAEVQAMIKAYGLENYIKNVKQESVRNILALTGTWFIISKFKKHWPWAVGGFAALYLFAKTTSTEQSSLTPNTIASGEQNPNGQNVSGYNNRSIY